jgi:hypothetical protein
MRRLNIIAAAAALVVVSILPACNGLDGLFTGSDGEPIFPPELAEELGGRLELAVTDAIADAMVEFDLRLAEGADPGDALRDAKDEFRESLKSTLPDLSAELLGKITDAIDGELDDKTNTTGTIVSAVLSAVLAYFGVNVRRNASRRAIGLPPAGQEHGERVSLRD